jgi:WD40 repeat protein
MAIKVVCACGKNLKADPRLAGKRVPCPACKTVLQIPADEAIPELDIEVIEEETTLPSKNSEPDEEEDGGAYAYQDDGMAEEESVSSGRLFAGEIGIINLKEPPDCLAYSPNHAWAAAGVDLDIQVLDMKNHKRAYRFRKHEDPVTSLCFTPNSKQVVSGDASGRIIFWDLEGNKTIRRLKGHRDEVNDIAISPSGLFAVSAGRDGAIRLWELASGDEYDLAKATWDVEVRCVSFSPDGRLIAAGGESARVGLWSVKSGERLQRLEGADDTITSLSFSQDGDTLTACGRGALGSCCDVWKWTIPSGTLLPCWQTPSKSTGKVLFKHVAPGGGYLIAVTKVDRCTALGDKNSCRPIQGPNMAGMGVLGAGQLSNGFLPQFDPEQYYRLQTWNVNSGILAHNFLFSGHRPDRFAASPTGQRALLGTGRGDVHVWGLG